MLKKQSIKKLINKTQLTEKQKVKTKQRYRQGFQKGSPYMKQLVTLTSIILLAFSAMQSHAAGTQAGVVISNQATVTYTAGAGNISASSQIVTITVQELINATVISQDAANVSVSSPQTDAFLKFQITNTGNGNEAFLISQSDLTGNDEFDVGASTIYLDDGDGVFEPGTDDILYNTPSISPDASIVIWAASNIPSGQADGNRAEVQVSALSKTFSDAGLTNPNAGDFVSGTGDSNTDAVYGTGAANADDTGIFIISAITVTVNKEVTGVSDNLGGSGTQPIPGADVEYTLTVKVIGSGTANTVVVSDPLPIQLKLKGGTSGTITVNTVPMTAVSDGDIASYDANTNTITVNLGDVTAGVADSIIIFTTTIQ